jgi:membrane fusion protein (multidrug efflux system)
VPESICEEEKKMTQPTPSSDPLSGATATSRRRRRFGLLGAAVLLSGAGYAAWQLVYGDYESTEDAYVQGDVVEVTSQVPGSAVAVKVRNTDRVAAGEPLVELDATDARLALNAACEQLARAVRDVRASLAMSDSLRAQVQLRAAEAEKANGDLQRREALGRVGVASTEDVRHVQAAALGAQAALAAAQEQLAANLANTDNTSIETNPTVMLAAAQLRMAALALHRTVVPAPLNGVVTKRAVQVGQHVAAGTTLMEIVPLDRLWVEANFRESQLRRIRPGQPVELEADVYGGQVVYHCRVLGLEAGTGAAFAAIPAQNASGNWIKVVQRVPVRIALDPAELADHPLLIGLSMTATVKVSGAGAASGSSDPPPRREADATAVYQDDARIGDELVSRIIKDNGGAAQLVKPVPTVGAPAARGSRADAKAGGA